MSPNSVLATLLGVAALLGCGSSPKVNFYALGAAAPAHAAEERAAAGATARSRTRVFIGPVTVPEAVNRPQVVVRSGGSQVTMSEFERWAEPLRTAIPRVVADNLSRQFGDGQVAAYPQQVAGEPDYRVLMDVVRFDSTLGEGVVVEALWSVRAADSEETRTGRSYVREPVAGPDYDALVAAHNRALDAVSRDIAAAIRGGGAVIGHRGG